MIHGELGDLITSDDSVRLVLSQEVSDEIEDIKWTALNSNSNVVFQAEGVKGAVYLRLPRQFHAGLKVINHDAEEEVLMAVSELGIGPQLLLFIKSSGLSITKAIDGQKVSLSFFSSKKFLRQLVDTIKRVHSNAKVNSSFYPTDAIYGLVKRVQSEGVSLPDDFDDLMGKIEDICCEAWIKDPAYRVLSHNDLHYQNIIVSANYFYGQNSDRLGSVDIKDAGKLKVWILDWEYAAMGNLFYDLSSLTLYLLPYRKKFVLRTYFGVFRREDYERLKKMEVVNSIWSGVEALCKYSFTQDKWFLTFADDCFNQVRSRGLGYRIYDVFGLRTMRWIFRKKIYEMLHSKD